MKHRVGSGEEQSLRCKQRQRRPHKKSRSGCANCRFRRVKVRKDRVIFGDEYLTISGSAMKESHRVKDVKNT